MTTPVVIFNYTTFLATYPEFAALTEPMLQNYFDMSDAYFKNDGSNASLSSGLDRMTRLAYMVTAHIAYLMAPRDAAGNPSSSGTANQTVGQITNASEGSVSVGFANVGAGGSDTVKAFFAQTKYGLMYWQATAQYRQMNYIARPTLTPLSVYPTRPYPRRGGW